MDRVVTSYLSSQISGYPDATLPSTQRMHDLRKWVPTLNCLFRQRDYLEELLSKTATTLYALRDRQTRNERILSTHPTPRSKRKKIQQNRWRTGKTIQTCENEERVILDCLQVCEDNIHTLETMINPPNVSDTSTGQYITNFYDDLDSGVLDWEGWTDDAPVSPFEKDRERPLPMDELPPETSPRSPAHIVAGQAKMTLSAEAAEFLPNIARMQQSFSKLGKELDKLTISGFLAAKRRRSHQTRPPSDVADRVRTRRLSDHVRSASAPARADDQQSTGPRWARQESPDEMAKRTGLKRSNSM